MSTCDIDGVVVGDLDVHTDNRGWLAEIFRRDDCPPDRYPAMAYLSVTYPGVVRGPHEHRDQTDYFCFAGPSTFRLYLWDNRPGSPTFGRQCTFELGETRRAVVLVPPGVVHAYKNIGAVDGLVVNAPNRLYGGEGKNDPVDEIRHEHDPGTPFRVG